tara:strand:- start:1719 stop:2096 length:378 start_codon:yes stop_codon:yes gene_type:complete
MGRMKEVFMQMREERWMGCEKEYLRQYANKLKKKNMPNWTTYIDDLEFECVYDPGEKQTWDHPGASLTVEIQKVWATLEDRNGNPITVNVKDILDQDIDYESALEIILEEIENDEPDPDRFRDDY